MRAPLAAAALLPLANCAGLQFNPGPQGDALTYREPVPYLFVATARDCTETATLISLPGAARSVTFKNGWGTANLTVALKDGMITSVGQQTDSQIPQTITALSGLATSAGIRSLAADGSGKSNPPPKPAACQPGGRLYPINENGPPTLNFPATLVGG